MNNIEIQKKLVFIGMGFHFQNTKSSQFFIDILRQYFDNVETVSNDEAWRLIPKIKPDTIIIWQQIFTPEQIDFWNVKNVIIIPMYDACPVTLDFWMQYKKYKIFCFSKTLFSMLKENGFNCFHSQYYIAPKETKNNNENLRAFFWERNEKLTWPQIKKVCQKLPISSLHYHTGLSATTEGRPTDEDIKKYNIDFSSWFKDPSEYAKIISETDIYFAPRVSEGIGLSFIEALANGCLVVAFDAPTMNEYIIDGKDGILFSNKNTLEHNFTKEEIEKLRKASVKKAEEGFKSWNESIPAIASFIKTPLENYEPKKTFSSFVKYFILAWIKYIIKKIIFWKQIKIILKKLSHK